MKARLRQLTLARQGLLSLAPFGKGTAAALKAVEHLGYVQIDTLSVVERAHHHILWTRIPDYQPEYLQQLLRDRLVFEYWHHAASYLPMRDYRFALPRMKAIRNGASRYFNDADPHLMCTIYDRIRVEGPLRVRDVNTKKQGPGSWWNWGKGKHAVEKLFMQGDLMVLERSGMEKVYDLTERILPAGLNLQEPSIDEYAAHIVERTFKAHGFTTWKQITHLKTDPKLKKALRAALDERIDAGLVTEFGGEDTPLAYMESAALRKRAAKASSLKLLSPFDNAIIHRDRLSQFFGFDYRLECYVPSHKRMFGYFCLPMLFGDTFIGRIDCKAHRSERRFEVLNIHIENNAKTDTFIPHLSEALKTFATFNNCSSIDVHNSCPPYLRDAVRQEI